MLANGVFLPMTKTTSPASIRLVIFDWAGTTVDHGCFAPVIPFVEALAQFGVEITLDEAREPMGLGKRDHLKALLQTPRIGHLWQARHGRGWTEEDLDRIYQEQFIPRQLASVRDHCELIPGLLDVVAWLRSRGIKIGTSTGYFAEAAADLRRRRRARLHARPQRHAGRRSGRPPPPWMIYRNMEALGVYPPSAVVKIGDTVPDIDEGLAAGVWSIGVTHTGSDVGLTAKDFASLGPADRQARIDRARQRLVTAGRIEVLASINDLPALIERLDARLAPVSDRNEIPNRFEKAPHG